eukprot:3980350-Lingulodinium_polyedra.AAC.1
MGSQRHSLTGTISLEPARSKSIAQKIPDGPPVTPRYSRMLSQQEPNSAGAPCVSNDRTARATQVGVHNPSPTVHHVIIN